MPRVRSAVPARRPRDSLRSLLAILVTITGLLVARRGGDTAGPAGGPPSATY